MSWLIAETIGEHVALLTEAEVRHLRSVRRERPGRAVGIIDGQGTRARGIWRGDHQVEIECIERFRPSGIRVAIGLGSRESNEESLRRAAELGAEEILPMLTRRSRDAGAARKPPNVDRWQRILESGCAQSGNPWFPRLADCAAWDELRADWTAPGHVVCAPGGRPLVEFGQDIRAIAIGPEGGFVEDEIAGLQRVGLGRWILRTPVAVAVALGTMEQAA
ncbi:MAG: RsmE family RNA methyltransferase [Candidatus Dadabacteria bacterium]|nr:MAG: RsmE family RNA methyltransferase [Candidatus Dadabacteria bacterium]